MAALPLELGTKESRHLRMDNQKFGSKLIRYAVIADQLQRRFDEATDNPNHFEKVRWFANYWNETIENWAIEGFERVTGPGLDREPSAWGD
jgi:hypothetical protein